MKSKFDSLTLGLIMGILVPVISMLLFFSTKCKGYSMIDCMDYSIFQGVLPQILSMCVLPNLGLFFLFIWRNHYSSARGVLYGTIACAAVILGIKIFM